MFPGTGTALSAGCVAAGCLAASPYLAGLTRTAPDRADRRWWRFTSAGRSRRVATAIVAVVLGVLAGAAGSASPTLAAFAVLALIGTPLVVIDCEHHRLPDRLMIALGAAAVVLLAVAAVPGGHWSAFGRAMAAAGVVFAVLFPLNLASPRSFGLGDVKLGAILGAYLGWFGWPFVLWGVTAGFLLGAVASLALVAGRLATMRTAIPFGPALLGGALVAVSLGRW